MCSNLVDLQVTIDVFEKEKVEYLHIDVMDGNFVPNFAFGTDCIRAIRKEAKGPLYAHMMCTKPIEFIKPFAELGVDYYCFHLLYVGYPAAGR